MVCTALDQCHDAGTCQPATGVCSNPTKTDGVACDDASICNGHEACVAGICTGSGAPTVDDGNPCTVDSCDPVTGVAHVAAANGSACDDNSLCNGHETCQSGSCSAGLPPNTDDGNDCTTDACDATTGAVTHSFALPGVACASIDACHAEGSCDGGGSCDPGEALSFDDGDPCTVETCSPDQGLTRRTCARVDATVATVVADANAWIYAGDNPLQTGVAPGTIVRNRGALVTGRVLSRTGEPLGGAQIAVLRRPEFGQTVSQTNGEFVMVVNGGGQLVVQIRKAGFLPADRSLDVAPGRAVPERRMCACSKRTLW